MKKPEIEARLSLAANLLLEAQSHLITIENEFHNFDYSKPVNIIQKEIGELRHRLQKHTEKYARKKFWDIKQIFDLKIIKRG